MNKFYKDGNEFRLDNLEILDKYPVDTSFFKVNSHSILSFTRENYCFKIYENESYLLVMHLYPYNLLLFGDKKLIKEAVDTILDYHLYFYGVLSDKELIEEFYSCLIDRRGGEKLIRYHMDIMMMDELKFTPTNKVEKATINDVDKIVEYNIEFKKEALNETEIKPENIIESIKNEIFNYYLLKINDEIVSIAKVSRIEDKIASISCVYTPINHRNKGYSAQVVSTICMELLKQGKKPYLYVDKANPISNHLYSKLGFYYGKSKYDIAYKQGNISTLVVAGGCFWCMAKPYYEIEGVTKVLSGYCGGKELFPTYELVKDHKTGHRESILIEFDKTKLSTSRLLDIYFDSIDPFDNSGQFIDKGFNYTCAIFSNNDNVADYLYNYKYKMEKKFNKKVYIDLEMEQVFFKAEEYHQDYALKNPKEMEEELISSGRKK